MIPNDQISLRGQEPRKAPKRKLDIFASLRNHLGMVLLLFLGIAAGGGWIAYKMDRPVFVSEGEIQVARQYQRTVETDSELSLAHTRDYDIFRNEQVDLMTKPEVLIDALRRADQLDLSYWRLPGEPDRVVAQRLEDSLVVYAIPNSYRIKVEMYASLPDIPQPLLQELMLSFLEAHRTEFFFAEDQRPEVIRGLLQESDDLIAGKREKLRKLASELKVVDFSMSADDNPWAGQLADARNALAEARRTENSLQLEHDALVRTLTSEDDLLLLLAQGTENAQRSPLADSLQELLSDKQDLETQLTTMGPQHPGRKDTETRLTALNPRIQDAIDRFTKAQTAESGRELELAKARTASLVSDVDGLEGKVAAFVDSFQRGADLQRQIEDEQPRNQRLRDRLAFFELEAQSPGFVSIAREASEVDPEGTSDLKRSLILALMFAMMVALSVPIGLDLLDRKVRTTQDVELALGIPPAAWIPRGTRGPRKAFADAQVRRLAMLMDNEERRLAPHITLFTEVRNSDGTPELISSSAQTLAELGRRVLVIDARPHLAGQEQALRGRGFQGLLAGDGLHPESRGAWDYLPYGAASHGHATSLSTWNRTVRDTCRDYDMVLVATAPLLVSPEAEYMAASADLVLMVAEAETQTLGELFRAGQILARLRPAAVGSVLNRVRVFRNRGYYKELVRETKRIA